VAPRKFTSADFIKSFHSKYEKNTRNGCWEWFAAKDVHGYGRIGTVDKKIEVASRFSWRIHHGDIPSKMCVCHKCDNPCCVNPEHLFLGTYQDNALDSKRKGRSSKPPVHEGASHHRAKLNERQVLEIRSLYRTKRYSQRALGRKFGMHQTVVGKIIRGDLWKEVNDAL